MSILYECKLKMLREEIAKEDGRPKLIDSMIYNLYLACREDIKSEDLIKLFSDRVEYIDIMSSLLHAVEAIDPPSYVRSLLAAAPSVSKSAPRWASTLLVRVLNSDSHRSEAAERLRFAPEAVKEAVRGLCARINADDPSFLDKTAVLLDAAS